MAQEEMLPYQCLIEMVRDYCTQRRTGTVFIVSSDNRMAQVHLESGAIVALLCRGRRGLDAIAHIRDMIAGRLRFDDNFVSAQGAERFDTDQTLALLGCAAQPAGRARAAPATPAAAAAGPVSQQQAAKLEAILIQYIGPMGEIVCADHVAEAGNARALVAALSGEVPDKDQAAFVREANAVLGLS